MALAEIPASSELGPEDEACLLAAIAEAERGKTLSASQVLAEIRQG
jgi:hypothetical protein